jgi:hypothetical protein
VPVVAVVGDDTVAVAVEVVVVVDAADTVVVEAVVVDIVAVAFVPDCEAAADVVAAAAVVDTSYLEHEYLAVYIECVAWELDRVLHLEVQHPDGVVVGGGAVAASFVVVVAVLGLDVDHQEEAPDGFG